MSPSTPGSTWPSSCMRFISGGAVGAAKQTRIVPECGFAGAQQLLASSFARIVYICNLILCVPALHLNERISSIRSRFMGVLPLQIIPRRPGKVFQTTTMKFHPSRSPLSHPVRARALIMWLAWLDQVHARLEADRSRRRWFRFIL